VDAGLVGGAHAQGDVDLAALQALLVGVQPQQAQPQAQPLGQTLWLIAVAAPLGAVALGRLVGLALDGFDRAVAPPLVVEVVMVAVLLASHALLGVG